MCVGINAGWVLLGLSWWGSNKILMELKQNNPLLFLSTFWMGFSEHWSGKMWSPRRDRLVSLFPFHGQGDEGSGKQWPWGHTVQQQGCRGGLRVLLLGAFALIPVFSSLLREMEVIQIAPALLGWKLIFPSLGWSSGGPNAWTSFSQNFSVLPDERIKPSRCGFFLLVPLPQDAFPCLWDCPFQRLSIATKWQAWEG